ncbi:phosphatidylserine decarboxylase [Arcobacter sp. CECT 8985]|uniref:phosphatidylserine decarboxylase n=1 Tax=Arcobacter sp. CECT 8985 TaxID=1935424 RepID=UPI00100C3513|nr:phosphatidylserine decarboxylase [Arcobacter sp. CECT 8985]RXJ86813.1 hypothetical protein CRU93_07000 [Arcobacter sp. CECT 8985]
MFLDKYILNEGQKVIISLFAIALILEFLNLEFLSALAFFTFFATIFIYRNKKVNIDQSSILISPISGEVQAIDFDDKHKIIYINTSLFDNSILLAPQTGKIKLVCLKRGINLPLNDKKSKLLNEKLIFEQKDIKVELLSSTATNRLFINNFNNSVNIGEKIGIFTQGEVILFIKKEKEIFLKIGQKIEVGQKLL